MEEIADLFEQLSEVQAPQLETREELVRVFYKVPGMPSACRYAKYKSTEELLEIKSVLNNFCLEEGFRDSAVKLACELNKETKYGVTSIDFEGQNLIYRTSQRFPGVSDPKPGINYLFQEHIKAFGLVLEAFKRALEADVDYKSIVTTLLS